VNTARLCSALRTAQGMMCVPVRRILAALYFCSKLSDAYLETIFEKILNNEIQMIQVHPRGHGSPVQARSTERSGISFRYVRTRVLYSG
jgi:hypothetical protein